MRGLATLLSWLMLPVYVWQGLDLRRRIERMVPPKGSLSGLMSASSPEEAPLRVLVLGDSSAAGVGVSDIRESLAPRLAAVLNKATGQGVYWRTAGSNSAVSADVRDHVVPHLAREAFTHIVLLVGTNDTKNFHTARRFKKTFGTLLYALRAKWPEARLVWSPAVDLRRVPALPRGLAIVLELRAAMLRKLGAQLCGERGAIAASTLPRVEPPGFARDGFHASAAGYAYMAEHLARFCVEAPVPSTPEILAGGSADLSGSPAPSTTGTDR